MSSRLWRRAEQIQPENKKIIFVIVLCLHLKLLAVVQPSGEARTYIAKQVQTELW